MQHSTFQLSVDEQIAMETTQFLTSSLALLDDEHNSELFYSDVMDVDMMPDAINYTDMLDSATSSSSSSSSPSSPLAPPSPVSSLSSSSQSLDESVEIPLKLVQDQVWAKIGNNWYNMDGEINGEQRQQELIESDNQGTECIDTAAESCQKCQTKPKTRKTDLKQANQCLNQMKKRNIAKHSNKKRGERLWEFLLRLLGDHDTNPSLIEWVDKDNGIFRLNQSKAISQIWGLRKNNSHMTYEKLSRAMRFHYRRQILEPVYGKKLVYKFGPHSTGW